MKKGLKNGRKFQARHKKLGKYLNFKHFSSESNLDLNPKLYNVWGQIFLLEFCPKEWLLVLTFKLLVLTFKLLVLTYKLLAYKIEPWSVLPWRVIS